MSSFSTARLVVVVALVVAGSALVGYCQTSNAQGWWNNDTVIKKLDLPDKTVQALREKQYETQETVVELHGQVRAAQLKLRQLLEQEKPDRAEIDKTIEKISDLQTQIHKARVHHLLYAREQLTPEQQQKIKKMLKSRIQRGVRKASARSANLAGPARDRIRRQDRECILQGWDQPQRIRDRMNWPQRGRQQPGWNAQRPFAARGPQRAAGNFGRYSQFNAPSARMSAAFQAPIVPEEAPRPPQASEVE